MRVILFLLMILFCSCNRIQNSKKEKVSYFEGMITYSIDYLPLSDKYSKESLKKSIGAKMILTFKEGNYKKQYYSSNGNLLSQRYLNLEEQRSYSKSVANDTIYWFDITKSDSKTQLFPIKDTTILNYPTIGMATETLVSGLSYGYKTYREVGEYYFAKDLKVDPNWYVDYKESNFYEMMKFGQGMQLFSVNENFFWAQIFTAISIETKDIDKSDITLKIGEDDPLKEL